MDSETETSVSVQVKLAEKTFLDLSIEQKVFLDEMTTCNISARYPDFKNRFYKKVTQSFT